MSSKQKYTNNQGDLAILSHEDTGSKQGDFTIDLRSLENSNYTKTTIASINLL